MKTNISIRPNVPYSSSWVAHGKMKTASTSKMTKSRANT